MILRRDIGKTRDIGVRVATVLFVFIAGCHLPNVQPYAEATAELRDAIEATGEVTVARMKGDSEPFDPENPPEPADPAYPAWELAQAWDVRLAAANALVTYADALADITAAEEASADNMRDLAGAINEIAASLPGVAAPSAEVVALATKLGEIAIEVKAAHDLAEAIERAQPAVEGIADILAQDWDDVLVLYQAAHRMHVKDTFLRSDTEKSMKYLEFATYHTELKNRVEALRVELQTAKFENPPGRDLIAELKEAEELLARAEASDGPYYTELKARVEALRDELRTAKFENPSGRDLMAEVREAEELLAITEAQAGPYLEAYNDLARERQRVEALFKHAKQATAEWLQTHRDLAAAIKANRRPNWRELLKTTQELHVLIDALRADERSIDRIGQIE